jgi:hypothetical protein
MAIMPPEQQTQTPLPNVRNSVFLMLALLDDVVQRTNLNLPVQVQAIQGISQAIKTFSDILDRPNLLERNMNMLVKTRPEMMQQLGQMGQTRTDVAPQTTNDLQRFEA